MIPSDSLIYTNNGIKKISELSNNTKVITHKNRSRNLDSIEMAQAEDIFTFKIANLPSFYTTSNQVFLTTKIITNINEETKQVEYYLDEPTWLPVKEITQSHLLAVPYDDRVMNDARITLGEAWLLGKFFAKGYSRKKGDIVTDIVIENSNDNVNVYREKLQGYIIHSGINQNYRNIYIKKGRVELLFKDISNKKNQRQIPNIIMELPATLLKEFLFSFMEECMKESCSEFYKFEVTSRKMAYQLGRLISKAFRVAYVIKEKIYDNVKIYEISFNENKSVSIIRRNIFWSKIEYIKKANLNMELFDLSVDEDNSFVCNNIVTGDKNLKKGGLDLL